MKLITCTFSNFARAIAYATGRPSSFLPAVAIVVTWGLTGPIFRYSDTWQLVINTGTTIVTFLMVFLIQNTQNRDGEAVQLKLDELIRAVRGAHNDIIEVDKRSDEVIHQLRARYDKLVKIEDEIGAAEKKKKGV